MSNPQGEIKKAVECGYWQLYHYNPDLIKQGKNPFILDSKEPTGDYQDFIRHETRYASLLKTKPDIAATLFERSEEEAKERFEKYKELSEEQK